MLIVVNANPLFSAMIAKGKSLDLFFHPELELVSPEFIIEEFLNHKDEIIEKSKLNNEELISFFVLSTSRIKFFRIYEFKEFLPEAEKLCPDPDDIDYFALALKLNCPIWTNDKKLKEQDRIKIHSTEDLVKELSTKY